MTAAEARKLTIEFSEIRQKIDQAIFNGGYSITVYELKSSMKERLESLGYTVKFIPSGHNEVDYQISW